MGKVFDWKTTAETATPEMATPETTPVSGGTTRKA
jgi:hypothetical protein